MSRILVTDGDSRAALAVTRALGRRGHWVLVGEKSAPALAHTSKYCSHAFVYPDPVADQEGFLACLLEVAERERVEVIMPVADIATMLVTERTNDFARFSRVPFADCQTIAKAADKVELVQTAVRLGVPVPRSQFVMAQADAVRGVEADLPYPLVIKPHRSRVRTPAGWLSCGVSYAQNEQQLLADLHRRRPAEFPLILQERIIGPGVGVFASYRKGQPVALFSHRRVREKPPWGGVSVLSESIALCPRTRSHAERLLSELRWEGVAMVEFKVDRRDGEAKLMEINGRFWGSLQLAIDAGVDFPNILLDTTDGRAPLEVYRIGLQSRWFWGDVDSLLLKLRRRAWPTWQDRGSRLNAVRQFLRMWGSDLHYENPKLYDLRPFLHETLQWIRQ